MPLRREQQRRHGDGLRHGAGVGAEERRSRMRLLPRPERRQPLRELPLLVERCQRLHRLAQRFDRRRRGAGASLRRPRRLAAATILELRSILDTTVAACNSGGPCIDPVFGPTVPTSTIRLRGARTIRCKRGSWFSATASWLRKVTAVGTTFAGCGAPCDFAPREGLRAALLSQRLPMDLPELRHR